tara:strand:+ start:386 stop:718 length:333 start_codon:yes stop_codon:yes gene_type:complete
MFSFFQYPSSTLLIIFLLIINKLLILIFYKLPLAVFCFWAIPFLFFSFFLYKKSIKSYQTYAFILLLYFMFSSLRVFGVPNPLHFDITELVLVILAFINTMYGPKNINSN